MNELVSKTALVQPSMSPVQRALAAFLARYPSEHSRRAMVGSLQRAASVFGRQVEDVPWPDLTNEAFSAVRAELVNQYSPATVNLTLSAVRQLLKTCWRMGLTQHDDFLRAIDVPQWRSESLPAGRMIPPDELRRLFAVASGSSPLARRDSAMLAILLGCGLRAAEVVGLTMADYHEASGELRIIRGKGNKDRMAYLAPAGRRAVARWIEVRGQAPGALLCDVRRAGDPCVGSAMPPLSSKGLYYRVRQLVRLASLGHASPHDFRRTHISLLLAKGHDIVTVQRLVGHASVTTTSRYDRRPEAVRRAAAESIEIPYKEDDDAG